MHLLWGSQTAAYAEECALRGIPSSQCNLLDKLIADYKSCSPFWLLTVSIVYMMSNVFRALRWQQMLVPLGIQTHFYNALFLEYLELSQFFFHLLLKLLVDPFLKLSL